MSILHRYRIRKIDSKKKSKAKYLATEDTENTEKDKTKLDLNRVLGCGKIISILIVSKNED